MKSKTLVIIGGLFAAYIAFVAVVVLVYDPSPDDMNWEDRQLYNSQRLTELHLGQDINEVSGMFSKADFAEAKSVNDTQWQVFFFRTHQVASDGKTTKDECTPLIFKDNKLIAWGEDTYKQYLDAGELAGAAENTPTAPQKSD